MSRTLRYYSVASLAVILVAGAAMVVVFRGVSVRSIEKIAETSNLALGRMALGPVRHALADYLVAVAGAGARADPVPLPRELHEQVGELMRDVNIRRVKIYDANGVVAFSTRPLDVGFDHSVNRGVRAALDGKVTAHLVYGHSFNPFDRAVEEESIVESYFPVRRHPTEPVLGVFEIYTDVGTLVHVAERAEMQAIAATLLILAVLYAALLGVVGRVRASLEAQQATIRETTAVLELLSQESLRREERERKKFATDLHEGLAQTLTAVKMAIESAQRGPAEGAPLKSVVSALQGAIGQVRTIAMDLRPPSLDDLGLVASIDALCREFRATYPGIRVDTEVAAGEDAVPARLKFVIYRIVEGALKFIGQQGRASDVRIRLEVEDRTLSLRIEDNAQGFDEPHADLQSPFSAIHERAIITGGRLAISRTPTGGLRLVSSWSPVAGTASDRISA